MSPKLEIASANKLILYDNCEEVFFHGSESKEWANLDNISKYLIDATVYTEDKNFYKHFGFDIFRIVKASIINIKSGSTLQGASTISQQYAKNLFLTFDKTWKRKWEEMLYTIRIESAYSKKEILEGYLNSIYFDHGIYGVEDAALYYFDKPSSNLTLLEAATLAAIPKGPTIYSPIKNPENNQNRRNLILKEMLEDADCWILSRFNTVVKEVTDNMESFELGVAAQKIYDFIYDDLCDWYIEMVKPRLYNSDDAVSQNAALWTLKTVLLDALKLLHPYMPFITEEIFCTLQSEEESIMISKWPEFSADRSFAKEEKDIETIKEAVRGIRNIRSEMNVAPSRKAMCIVVSESEDIRNTFTEGKLFFASLAYANEVLIQSDKEGIAQDAVSVVIPGAVVYIPFAELVDIAQEIERLQKEEKRLQGELARVNGMLSNEKFVSKAPAAKIEEEKAKLAKYTQMMEQVKERLAQLQ